MWTHEALRTSKTYLRSSQICLPHRARHASGSSKSGVLVSAANSLSPSIPQSCLLQDGVDISGLGGALTSFDTAQIDILRGPQGAIMGAGALAGLINVETAALRCKRAQCRNGDGKLRGRRLEVSGNTPITPGTLGSSRSPALRIGRLGRQYSSWR